MSTTESTVELKKRSFLQLPVAVDVDRLLEDYRSIPSEAWASTHWDMHCSSNMVLLRGGSQGTEDDFDGTDIVDHEILGTLPYISWLIGESGPFGGTSYAFIFRMKPLGVARPHIDLSPVWFDLFRVHIPIVTNDGAYLLSEGRSKHLAVGEVWTFDNQLKHAVTNGDAVRTHLIFDVPPQPKLQKLIETARFDPGSDDPSRWQSAGMPDTVPSITNALSTPLSFTEKEALGFAPDAFASRIHEVRSIARITRANLKVGDIVYAVNGVSECAVARTATDYIQVRHRPGEVVTLQILRGGGEVTTRVRLYPKRIDALGKIKGRVLAKR